MKKMLILLSSVVLLFSLLIIPASAAESDFTLVYESVQVAESDVLLSPGSYTFSFDFSDPVLSDWVSDPVVISQVLPDTCMTPVLVYRDGVAVYSFLICEYEGVYTYEFTVAGEDDQEDFSYLGYIEVTFTPVSDAASSGVGVLDVFSAVGQWFVVQLGAVAALFVTVSDGVYHLTFFGIMTLVAIGLAVVLLLIRAVGSFLSMRR